MKKENHAFKLEQMDQLSIDQANEIKELLVEFCLHLGYSKDRIDDLECRSRDGFRPHSFNHGGIEAIAFTSQYSAYLNGTGFPNADETLSKGHDYDIECFKEDRGIPENQGLTEDQWEEFTEYIANDDQSDVLFSLDIMHTGFELDGAQTLNFRFCICVKDAPYHRQYDDLIDIDIEFNSAGDLVSKLETLKTNKQVKLFASNLEDAY